jgi:hypothetical protein
MIIRKKNNISKLDIAISEDRTLFPLKVITQDNLPKAGLLKPASNNQKLSGLKKSKIITKGKWKGMTMFSLTLEERKTCPDTCEHYSDCYGNNMRYASRYQAGKWIIKQLRIELTKLNKKHKNGFVIRLHILGDFYSVEYLQAWSDFLDEFENLHVFGYTRRHDVNDPIAQAYKALFPTPTNRWQIRFSGSHNEEMTALSETHELAQPKLDNGSAFMCPQQRGQTDGCYSCGLCFGSTSKTVVFANH